MGNNKHLFCFGLGYCAQHLSAELVKQSYHISGTHRSVVLGEDPSNLTLYEFDKLNKLPQDITHILISVPPRGNTDQVIERFAQSINNLPNLEWLAYLSATSVYGDHQGAWVDENTPVSLDFPFSRPRIMAENQWLNLWNNHKVPVHIFRLAGIYGPGRSEVEKALARQSRIIKKDGHVFSRIHVEDIVGALQSSINYPTPGEIFNIADDLPAAHEDVVRFTSELLGIPAPNTEDFETAMMTDMLRYFYSKCARVSNKKAKELLHWHLRYPSYREGIRALLSTCGHGA